MSSNNSFSTEKQSIPSKDETTLISISSGIAAAFIEKNVGRGEAVEIPSLNIKIPGDSLRGNNETSKPSRT